MFPLMNTRLQRFPMNVYTAKDAAKMMCICTETLRRIVRHDGIQHRRIGRRILFTDSDIAAILESRLMTGAVNPYARKVKQENKSTENEHKPRLHSDSSATVDGQPA